MRKQILGLASLALPLGAAAVEVGTSAGSFAVSDHGGATYTIPIAVPPGAAGLQPRLAIAYDSQEGSGLLGLGFSLDGLSQIARCLPTQVQDSLHDPIDFDGLDRFCLDGQRLVVVSPGAYGGVGAEYRTEIESFARIQSFAGTHGSPVWWKVTSKAGLVMQYGITADSRIDAASGAGRPLAWAVNRIIDASGNRIDFTWHDDATSAIPRPATITYADGAARIVFTYRSRTDAVTGYLAGVPMVQDDLLSAVTVYSAGSVSREYRLDYAFGGHAGQAQLRTVTECAAGGACLPPTSFEWPAHGTNAWTVRIEGGPAAAHPIRQSCLAGDLDGDALPDTWCSSGDGSWEVDASAGYGGTRSGPAAPWPVAENCLVGDLNADGRSDFWCSMAPNSTSWRAVVAPTYPWGSWTTHALQGPAVKHPAARYCHGGDLNGDARSDMWCSGDEGDTSWQIAITGFTSAPSWGRTTWSGSGISYECYTGDLNGDGLTDTWCKGGYDKSSTWNVMLARQGGWTQQAWVGLTTRGLPSLTGDLNGDGLIDMWQCGTVTIGLFVPITGCYAAVNTGTGWRLEQWNYPGVDTKVSCLAADANGDGRTDMLCHSSGNIWRVVTSTGRSWISADVVGPWVDPDPVPSNPFTHPWVHPPTVTNYCLAADADGDTRADVWCRNGATGRNWTHAYADRDSADLVQAFVTGLGARMEVDYGTTIDTALHAQLPYHLRAYPVVAAPPFNVVREHRSGGGMRRRVAHYYESAAVDVTGRGFLGFAGRRVRELETFAEQETRYRQDFPFIGMPSAVESEGAIETRAYASQVLGVGASQRQFPFASERRVQHREPGRTPHQTTITKDAYDAYGNVVERNETREAGAGGALTVFSTRTLNQFANDEASWRLGRLLRTEKTRQSPSAPPATQVTAYEYGPDGLVSAEIVEPGSTLELRTDLERDGYGNVRLRTVSGYDVPARTSQDSFDAAWPSLGRFNTTTRNALAHSTYRSYDAATGQVLASTDPAGSTRTFSYDAFGRAQGDAVVQNGINRWTRVERIWCADYGGCRPGEVYAVRSSASTGAAGISLHDAEQREVRSLSLGPDGAYRQVLTEYDTAGRVARKSMPHFVNASAVYWTKREYDKLDRVIREEAPLDRDGPAGRVQRFAYDGLVTRQYDALGRVTEREIDVAGNLVRITDAGGGTVTHGYDAFDKLLQTTDAGGAVTTYQHDVRGRKTLMVEPGMGSWSFGYDALGQLVRQVSPLGQVVTLAYDPLGRTVKRVEPEGTTTWTWDTARRGALTQVSSPNYQRRFAYHAHGAVREEVISIDQDQSLLGEIVAVSNDCMVPLATCINPAFGIPDYQGINDLLPPVTHSDNVLPAEEGVRQFKFQYAYDAAGRPVATTYPTGLKVVSTYNAAGAVERVQREGTSQPYWQAVGWDEWGNPYLTRLGNGIETLRSHDPAAGHLDAIVSGFGGGTGVQSLAYGWDANGNLRYREDHNQGGLREEFAYDALNRLVSATLRNSGVAGQLAVAYAANGNIVSKSDVGDYSYGAQPHAVTAAGANAYAYDAKGNLLAGGARVFTWTSFDQPVMIATGTHSSHFLYGPERQRTRQTVRTGAGDTLIYYAGSLFEEHRSGASVWQKHHIQAPDGVALIETWRAGAVQKEYLHKDHLGSLDVVTGATGSVMQRLSFDAFGKRRGVSWAGVPSVTAFLTARGFTGHEHLDALGLVHMNGRIYDPQLARFVSADPLVAAPGNTQSYNRYSYVLNNPLSYTDPSGYTPRWLKRIGQFFKQYWRPIAAVVAAVVTYGAASEWAFSSVFNAGLASAKGVSGLVALGNSAYFWGAVAGGASAGAVSGGIMGGSWKGAGLGAVTGLIGGSVLGYFGYEYSLGRVAADGLAAGANAEILGGSFRKGFYAGAGASLLAFANYRMRDSVIDQSCNGASYNCNGDSAGFFADGKNMAGARRDERLIRPCDSYTGGCQGFMYPSDMKSRMFSIRGYEAGSALDYVGESFAGPHDWLRNATGAYNDAGDSRHFTGAAAVWDEIKNWVLVPVASPFAAGAVINTNPSVHAALQVKGPWQ